MQLPEAIESIRRAVVQIQRHGSGTRRGSTIGSGFIVGDRAHVVTAKHVVDAVDFGAGQTIVVGFALPDVDTPELTMRANFVGTGAEVVDASAEHDIALLSVPGATELLVGVQLGDRAIAAEPIPARLSKKKPREGVLLAISGYPLNEPSLVTTCGTLASSFSLDREGPNPEMRYLGDVTANPGNSGGPVYTVSDAAVIGVCVAGRLTSVVGGEGEQAAGLKHAAGLTVIVPVEQVQAFLERNGVISAGVAGEQPAAQRIKQRRRRKR
jgi:S1-C subfamily serine protease